MTARKQEKEGMSSLVEGKSVGGSTMTLLAYLCQCKRQFCFTTTKMLTFWSIVHYYQTYPIFITKNLQAKQSFCSLKEKKPSAKITEDIFFLSWPSFLPCEALVDNTWKSTCHPKSFVSFGTSYLCPQSMCYPKPTWIYTREDHLVVEIIRQQIFTADEDIPMLFKRGQVAISTTRTRL